LSFHPVETLSEVLAIALEPEAAPEKIERGALAGV